MRCVSNVGLLAGTLLALCPAVASAEIPAETEPAPEIGAVVEEPAPAASRWPRAVIARPLTLPGNVFQAGLDQGANNDFSAMGSRLVAGYGLTDELEATVYYAFASRDFEAKGSVDVNVGYAAVRGALGGKLEVVPRAQAGYSVLGETANPLYAGAQVQYNATSKLALITPGGQLAVALAGDPKPITLAVPIAVGYQATPELYLQLDTAVATLGVSEADSAFLFADTTPLLASGIFNVLPALDVLAAFGLNATPAEGTGVGDTLSFLAGVRYYGGTL